MDLSLLKHAQAHGVEYKDAGQAVDPLALFYSRGVSYVRLRLFVRPDGSNGQVNTLTYTLDLAKQVKEAGFSLLLDFHNSDEWADPGHQTIPAEWSRLEHCCLVDRVFTYTLNTLLAFDAAGCRPDIVAVGNEVTNGMMWPAGGPFTDASHWNDEVNSVAPIASERTQWQAITDLLKAGINAVRACDPNNKIEIMIHIDKGGSAQISRWFFNALLEHEVALDVIGLSYYPFWHGTLSDLDRNLKFLSSTFDKDVIVVETGYDWCGDNAQSLLMPHTPEGQLEFLIALIRTVRACPRGRGIFYWAPEWVMGSKWNGPTWSNVWESRALFDHTGNALPAMRALDASRNWK